MSELRIANRYAKSILAEAIASGKQSEVYEDMRHIATLCSESKDLLNLLKSPVVPESKKLNALTSIFASVQDLTKSLLGLLTANRREGYLPAIAQSYIKMYFDQSGIAEATVTSAYALDEEALGTISKYLSGKLGKPEIRLQNVVDKKVIGGFVIRYEDKLLDMSVSKELKEIRKQLIYN